jgi:uncharacterized membrane protein YphA (DoxX/SURF4 family)
VIERALSNLGVHVYGLAAMAFGVIGLAYGDFATVWQPVQALPFALPDRVALAYICAGALLAGGIAIQWRPTARAAALVLGTIYFLFALLWTPRIAAMPSMYGTWGGFFEEFSLVAAAIIIFAPERAQVGRFLFGICAMSFALSHFSAIPETARLVPAWLPFGASFWAILTGSAFLLASIAILTGLLARLGSRLLTVMLMIFGALVWLPALFSYPNNHTVWGGNAVNLAVSGASWVVADFIARRKERVLYA